MIISARLILSSGRGRTAKLGLDTVCHVQSNEPFGGNSSGEPVISPVEPSRASEQSKAAIFACNGEYWTIGYADLKFTLRDVKGLNYIQRLLQHPGEEFHALDLVGAPSVEPVPGGERLEKHENSLPEGVSSRRGINGDSGEMLDAQAKKDYRRRLVELGEELEELRQRGAAERADEVQSEIEFLTREISRAVGLGGRNRRAGSVAERARLSVTRAIKTALQRMSEHQAAFAEMLERSIKTGLFCSYVVDSKTFSPMWQFSLDGKSPTTEPIHPLLLRRDTGLFSHVSGRTTFVGRDSERATLLGLVDQAMRGQGRVAMVVGPPGVGKTRIATEAGAEASGRGFMTLAGNCYDREDPIPFIPFVEILEEMFATAASPESFRQAIGESASEIARLLPQLRRLFPDIPAPVELPPAQSRRILFSAIAKVLAKMCARTPVFVLLEDLHWGDEGTLSLVSYLSEAISRLPILIVGTYRDLALNIDSPLAATLEELTRRHLLEHIRLKGLPEDSVGAMLGALSKQKAPETLVSLFYKETAGNPFFIEELYFSLVERERLLDSGGEFRPDLKFEEGDLPQSVRLVVARRLTRVTEETRRVLDTAAVIGRSFTFELLEASTTTEAEELLDCVEEAEGAGFVVSSVEYSDVQFRFSHELIRQAIVSTIFPVRRQRLHLEIAEAIKSLHAPELEEHAEDLAHHFWQAGAAANPLEAARYVAIAAKQAGARSANQEAIAHLKKGLKILRRAQDSPERRQLELQIQMNLGTATIYAKGYSASEVEEAFAKARTLSHELRDNVQLFHVLRSLAGFYSVRGDYRTGGELTTECLSIARSSEDPLLLLAARMLMGSWSCWLGDFPEALKHLEFCSDLHDPLIQNSHAFAVGQDFGVAYLSRMSHVLWFLGYPDQSLRKTRKALALARKVAHPFSLAYALYFASVHGQFRGDVAMAQEYAEEAASLSWNQGFPIWTAGATFMRGWALAQQSPAAGMAQMNEGLDLWRVLGAEQGLAYFFALLAEMHGKMGEVSEGLSLLDEMSAFISRTGEYMYHAEMYRLRGELLNGVGASATDPQEIEDLFKRAITISREQNSKSMELRASMSLSRFWSNAGKGEQARQHLGAILSWFKEGFETQDLKRATVLLEQLSLRR
jgi:tetratricopeptide (TPR) repeat protein